jgi:outer membrane protein assembly factor BamE
MRFSSSLSNTSLNAPVTTTARTRSSRALVRAATLVAAAIALSGCSSLGSFGRSPDGSLLGWVTPYRIEVVQGNVVTKEQAAQIKPGMSRAQVRDVLGSPLVADPFHADRWDYVFTIRRAGTTPQQRRIVVLFDGEKLKSIEAPDLPTEREFVDSIDTIKPGRRIPPLALTDEQLKALPVPPPVTAAASAPEGPIRTYPPLEPAAQ